MKVYLVTIGSYSDYRIAAAFSTEDLAKEFMGRFTYPDIRVEEYEVDAGHIMSLPRGHRRYYAWVSEDGSRSLASVTYDLGEDRMRWVGFPNDPRFEGRVWATSEEHAVKIISEKRAQALAMEPVG